MRGALEGERLRIVLGSTKRAFDEGEIEEKRYTVAMYEIAVEELERVKMLNALTENGPQTVPQWAEYVGVPKDRIWRHVLALTQKNIIEVVGHKDNYMIYQRRQY